MVVIRRVMRLLFLLRLSSNASALISMPEFENEDFTNDNEDAVSDTIVVGEDLEGRYRKRIIVAFLSDVSFPSFAFFSLPFFSSSFLLFFFLLLLLFDVLSFSAVSYQRHHRIFGERPSHVHRWCEL